MPPTWNTTALFFKRLCLSMSLISLLKFLLWLAVISSLCSFLCPLIQNHFQLVLVTMYRSILVFILCWVTLIKRFKQFFLCNNPYPTIRFNLAQLRTRPSVLASTTSTIWTVSVLASLFNSTSSSNDPILLSLFVQKASTFQKNDDPCFLS